ncbi:MAG: hypothetical protein HY313_01845 [Acidobacteria bacterium]|nr:hypothetical protein [Acidobacteriota bacterium]
MAVAATASGLFVAAYSEQLPAMVDGQGFTPAGKAMNFIGGLFFMAAGACLVLRYQRRGNKNDLLFANQCLLFGVAGLLFAYSTLWDAAWWYWHLLRMLAYFVVLGYAFLLYYRLQEGLRGSEVRNRALLDAIPDLIFRFHLDGTLLDFQAHETSPAHRMPSQGIIGTNIYESPMPREVVDQIMAASRQAAETKATRNIEFSLPRDSELRQYEARIVSSGPDELVAIVRNITERKKAEEELRALTSRLISAREEETKHLARELHDVFSQRLAVLGMETAAVEQQFGCSDPACCQTLHKVGEEIGSLARDVHQLSRELHPSILDDLGLAAALRAECAAFSRQHNIAVQFEPNHVPESLPGPASLSLYRIVQESLRNIGKHAGATAVRVTLDGTDGALVLGVEDNGCGFALDQIKGKRGVGLVSMEERIRLVDGSISIRTQPGMGTTVEARIPLGRSEQ